MPPLMLSIFKMIVYIGTAMATDIFCGLAGFILSGNGISFAQMRHIPESWIPSASKYKKAPKHMAPRLLFSRSSPT